MSSRPIILYDLPSRDPCKCWSLNPWKTRLLLNYKCLPYETEWVEYPDIKPKFKDLISPNAEGTEYTIPTIRLPDGKYIQDSRKIATAIEELQPSPPMHLNSSYLGKLESLHWPFMVAVFAEFVNKVPHRLLNEAAQPYWHATRTARFNNTPLDQVEAAKGGEVAWKAAAPIFNQVGEMLREQTNGPFFEGGRVSYADFVWVANLHFLERIGDDVFNGFMSQVDDKEPHLQLLEACRPWLERDDH